MFRGSKGRKGGGGSAAQRQRGGSGSGSGAAQQRHGGKNRMNARQANGRRNTPNVSAQARNGGYKRSRMQRDEDEDEDDDADEQQGEEDAEEEQSRHPAMPPLPDMEEEDEDDAGPTEYDQLLRALQGGGGSSSSAASKGKGKSQSRNHALSEEHAEWLRQRKLEEEGREDEGDEDDDEEVEEDDDEEGEYDDAMEDGEMLEDEEDEMDGDEADEVDEDGDAAADEHDDEDVDDEDEGAPAKRRKREADEDLGEDEEDGDEDEDDHHGPIEGDDVLSDADDEDEDDHGHNATSSSSAKSALTSPPSDLQSPDLFVRKYSDARSFSQDHIDSLPPREDNLTVAAQAQAAAASGNNCGKPPPPFKKGPDVKGMKELMLVSADPAMITPLPHNDDSTTESSSTVVPSFLSSPPTSLSSDLLTVRPKLIDMWRRRIVQPQRKKLLGKSNNSNASQKQQKPADEENEDDESDQRESLIPKDEPLLPPSTSCSSDCVCYACSDFYSPIHAATFSLLSSYRDLIHTHVDPHLQRGILPVLALHALNHLTKARENILAHNARISKWEEKERAWKEKEREERRKQKEAAKAAKKKKSDATAAGAAAAASVPPPTPSSSLPPLPPGPEYRDQGFTRARILALFPTAKVAADFLDAFLALLPDKQRSVEMRRKRFEQEFHTQPEDRCHPSKPFDYKALFDGKDSDAFRVGITIGQRSVKFYSSFYQADLIVASPLGLRMITGTVGDKLADRDYDFLSSIEVLMISHFDVCASMQNYQHILAIMAVMNVQPFDTRHTDFSRIRQWNLSGAARLNRQTILLSAHPSLELQAFQAKYCRNAEGKIQVRASYPGILGRVIPQIKQIFQRITCDKIEDLADARFDYFIHTLLPQLKSSYPDGHILVFIPSYFDYVRLRNYGKARHLSVAHACEYTKNSDLSRGRSAFFHGEKKFLFVTERFHFFRRYVIRGCKHVVFYAPPTYEQFYVDFLNLLPSAGASTTPGTAIALFSKFDSMQLERIIGTQRATKIIQAHNNTHMFC